MADLKPLGSEKLKGDDKLKRILELTYYNPEGENTKKISDAEYISESNNGVYGIVKEKDGYYVKKGLTESTLDYIGGMFMKNKNRFSSYAEALKRLELLKGQEQLLQEEKKYFLKVNKSAPTGGMEVNPPLPAQPETGLPADNQTDLPIDAELPAEDGSELPTDETGLESDLPADDESDSEDLGGDFLKGIQKLTGKLGEKLREYEDKLESDDIKYVINSVISAINLDKLDDSDKEDIISQIEDNEDFGDEEVPGDDEFGDKEIPTDDIPGEEIPDENPESELGEVDSLEALIDSSFDFGDDDNKPYDELEMSEDDDLENEHTFNPEDPDDEDEVSDEIGDVEDTDDGEVCLNCRGTGMKNHRECPVCHGEGVVYNTQSNEEDFDMKLASKKRITVDDLYDDDDDEGYDPIEMGEQDDESFTKEIELNELTDLINKSVKETLGKYFE